MRAASKVEIIKADDGAPCGILLGANFCGEHEMGIKNLLRAFRGMPVDEANSKRICDFSRIRVKGNPDQILWHEEPGLAILAAPRSIQWVGRDVYIPEKPRRKAGRKAESEPRYLPPMTQGRWDDSEFAVATRDPDLIGLLRDLYQALLAGDAVLHLASSDNPFQPVLGLAIAIESRVPQAAKDQFKAAHEDLYRLQDAAKATGIESRLTQAGKRTMALSPAWATSIKSTHRGEIVTSHPVVFFLNPVDQDKANYGWFTVEDLDLWTRGQGPIPK
jgi:hypothetical protein